jgi:hypothetical protein
MTRSRQTADWGSRAGLAKIVPSSVAVGSGTGSASALGTVTFTGASSVSLNGVFSTTYDNYRIIFTTTTISNIFMRLRVSNADETTSQYVYVVQGLDQGNTADNASSGGAGNTFHIGKSASSLQSSISLDLYAPKLSAVTSYIGTSMNRTATATMSNWDVSGFLNTTTSYDSVSIYNSASNAMTGTVSVYGYTI